jgi:hypothetical protein
MLSELKPQSRLHGRTVFLSASVPVRERRDEYERIEEAPIRIEEAVLCIARAVFVEGGTLVFGAHPSISPLVAQVIDDYYVPAPGERTEKAETEEIEWRNPSVIMYQSLVWEPYWAEITKQLSRRPLVEVKWTAAEPGESINLELKDRSQAPKSMVRMRKAMIEETSPIAMIAIGGMKGVLEEAELFMQLRPGRTIFTLSTTGGAAAVLARRLEYQESVTAIDREAESLVREFWKQQSTREAERRSDKEDLPREFAAEQTRKFYLPYAVVAQQIIARLVDDSENSPQSEFRSRAF